MLNHIITTVVGPAMQAKVTALSGRVLLLSEILGRA